MLDYAVEIEWADSHLYKMLNYLDSIGELDNTIVMVTADNGMPFPRAKANCFEYGVHVPLAISYPKGFPGKRQVDDLIGFVDIAPTILELAGVKPDGMLPISGRSIVNILRSEKMGLWMKLGNMSLWAVNDILLPVGKPRISATRHT